MFPIFWYPPFRRLIQNSQSDMYMLSGSNGRERTAAQFEALPQMADPRLRLAKITHPNDSWMSLIEIAFSKEKENS